MVRGLASLSLVKHLLSRSEESPIRQLPFPAMPIIYYCGGRTDAPEEDHPLWATQDSNTRSGDDTWRCKECHGWDYKGKAGAYASGKHFTGIKGVLDAKTSKKSIVAAFDAATRVSGG